MPTLTTKYFGAIDYEEDSIIRFPSGLPGFENEAAFLLLERSVAAPLVFLQSVATADLRLPALPVQMVEPSYELAVSADDLASLGLPGDRQPAIGDDVLCFAILAAPLREPATFNLLAPIVVNPKTRRGLQAIRMDSAYSHRHGIQHGLECS